MNECAACGESIDGMDRYCDDCIADPATRTEGRGENSIVSQFTSQATARKVVVGYLVFAVLATALGTVWESQRFLHMLNSVSYLDWRFTIDLMVQVGFLILYGIIATNLARGTGSPRAYAKLLYGMAGAMIASILVATFAPRSIAETVLFVRSPIAEVAFEIAFSGPEPKDWFLDNYRFIQLTGIVLTVAAGGLLHANADESTP